jgi:hypothetical protein
MQQKKNCHIRHRGATWCSYNSHVVKLETDSNDYLNSAKSKLGEIIDLSSEKGVKTLG